MNINNKIDKILLLSNGVKFCKLLVKELDEENKAIINKKLENCSKYCLINSKF